MANHPQGIPKHGPPLPSPHRRGDGGRDLLDFAWLLALAGAGVVVMLIDILVGFETVWRAAFRE